ncbi:MAG TPA: UTRA domain-containing protein [Actinomycetota bacterium]|jgi:hypothetical protein|nr:UTRA domain-containing protein [Actinomycetota bacterium]
MTDKDRPNHSSGEGHDEPSEEELERLERQVHEELTAPSMFSPGVEREEVSSGWAYPYTTGEWVIEELFPRASTHMKDDPRLSHAVTRWRDATGRPTHVVKFWTPIKLLTAAELSRADWVEDDLDYQLRERGVKEGAVRAREQIALVVLDEDDEDRALLELPAGDKVIRVTREFYDDSGDCVVYEIQVISTGHVVGHLRYLPYWKDRGQSSEW